MTNEEAEKLVKNYGPYAGTAYLEYLRGKTVSFWLTKAKQDKEDTDGYNSCPERGSDKRIYKKSVAFSALDDKGRESVRGFMSSHKKFFFIVKQHLTCKEIRLVRYLMSGHNKPKCAELLKTNIMTVVKMCESIKSKLEVVSELRWV